MRPCEPVAGLALADRFTVSTDRPCARCRMRGTTNASAPMFAGSSCTHTNSRAFAWRSISAASSASGNGYSCSRNTIAVGRVLPLLPLRHQFVPDFSRAHQHARRRAVSRIRNHALKTPRRQIAQRRRRRRIPQHALRRENDQRFPPRLQRLPPQQMKILRRGGRLADLNVVARRQLQKSLDARARMLRPLPFVPVRQQQRHARQQAPLVFARRNELVDDDLRAVREIAELRFPQHQRLRIIAAESVFESQHRRFATTWN